MSGQTGQELEQPKPEPFRIGEYVEITDGIYKGMRGSIYGSIDSYGKHEIQVANLVGRPRTRKTRFVRAQVNAIRRLTCVP